MRLLPPPAATAAARSVRAALALAVCNKNHSNGAIVSEFKYLGSKLARNCKDEADVDAHYDAEMVALVRATEGATLDIASFEEIASFIKADPKVGLSLQDLTNFFGLSETDDDLNENYAKLFPS